MTYDALGLLVRTEDPAGAVTTLERTEITDGFSTYVFRWE